MNIFMLRKYEAMAADLYQASLWQAMEGRLIEIVAGVHYMVHGVRRQQYSSSIETMKQGLRKSGRLV